LTTKPGVSVQRIGVRAHDLDERHQRRRVEEVHPDRALRAFEHGCDLGDRERRRVRREHRAVAHDRFEGAKELVLDGEILERRFDHDVAIGEIRELGRQAEARHRCVARTLLERPLLDLARQEMRDAIASAFAARGLDLAADRVEPRLDRELRNPGAHRPEPDDADLHRRSTTPAIAMPKPTHMDAIP
jgi:hypothetical protein